MTDDNNNANMSPEDNEAFLAQMRDLLGSDFDKYDSATEKGAESIMHEVNKNMFKNNDRHSNDLLNMVSTINNIVLNQNEKSETIDHSLLLNIAHNNTDENANSIVNAAVAAEYKEAFGIANLWLDSAVNLSPTSGKELVLRPTDWIDLTAKTWEKYISLKATLAKESFENNFQDQFGDSEDPASENDDSDEDSPMDSLAHNFGMIFGDTGEKFTFESQENPLAVVGQINSAVTAMGVGSTVGKYSSSVFGSYDFMFPLLDEGRVALVPSNVDRFIGQFDIPRSEMITYIAMREIALSRLFTNVPWLEAHLFSEISDFVQTFNSEMDDIRDIIQDLDVENPEDIAEAIQETIQQMHNTPEHNNAVEKIAFLLALIEGWVNHVAFRAGQANLLHIMNIREIMLRRQLEEDLSGGAFSLFLSTKVSVSHVKETENLWMKLEHAKGIDGRDAVWGHPDMLPTPKVLDNIDAYVGGASGFTYGEIANDEIEIKHDWDKEFENL